MTADTKNTDYSYTGYAVARAYMSDGKHIDYTFKTATHVYIAAAKASLIANLQDGEICDLFIAGDDCMYRVAKNNGSLYCGKGFTDMQNIDMFVEALAA